MKIEFFNPFSKKNAYNILFMICWNKKVASCYLYKGYTLCYDNFIQFGFYPRWFKYYSNSALKVVVILGLAFGYFSKED